MLFNEATAFYERVEAIVGRTLLDRQPSLRLFQTDQERSLFLEEQAKHSPNEIELASSGKGTIRGFWMLKAARLRVKDFLQCTRDYFARSGHYHVYDIDLHTDIRVQPKEVTITEQK